MSRRPRLLLLDAGAVFAALKHDAWDALTDAYEVVIGAVVVRTEAIFYTNRLGERVEIDLGKEVSRGKVTEIEMGVAAVEAVCRCFAKDFRDRLDDGELEAIAYLLENAGLDIRFVSSDGRAIQAVAMLDDDQRAISLEEALERCGHTKNLPHQLGRDFTRANLEQGSVRRIQRDGLA